MAEPDARWQIDECGITLKSKILPLEHGALDSRVEQLLNDPSADSDDVILILPQEFDPECATHTSEGRGPRGAVRNHPCHRGRRRSVAKRPSNPVNKTAERAERSES
jgi:hypothetical protein